jgi:tRNA pseudouridine13 synthase
MQDAPPHVPPADGEAEGEAHPAKRQREADGEAPLVAEAAEAEPADAADAAAPAAAADQPAAAAAPAAREAFTVAVREADVGIAEYANGAPGFTGILRHRYTDFRVNEVGFDGAVVRLTTLAPPAAAPVVETAPAAALLAPADVAAAVAELAGVAAGELTELAAFLAAAAAGERPAPVLLPPLPDKAARSRAHGMFKALPWLPPLNTDVAPAPAGADAAAAAAPDMRVRVALVSAPPAAAGGRGGAPDGGGGGGGRGGGGRGGGRGRPGGRFGGGDGGGAWPGGALRFCSFSLYKENMDTQAALGLLGRALGLRPGAGGRVFGFAGTKDKRAITTQRVTALRVPPARLAAAAARLRGLAVGDFGFARKALRLGDLAGNRFAIVLRGVPAADAPAVAAAAAALSSSGFINYYGLQRFGSGTAPTHRVGAALLRGEWKAALRLIVAPGPCPRPEIAAATALFLEKGDAAGALAGLPRYLVAERAALGVLARDGANARVNALLAIPRNLRTMYVHAYQSYLWNTAASARAQRFGLARAVEGDLVLPRAEMAAARAAKADGGGGVVDGGGGEDGEEGGEGDADVDAEAGRPALVSAADAAAGRYSIEDVVLPAPGHATRYPGNGIEALYRELAAADGVALSGAAPHAVPDFSMRRFPGAYRHLLCRPGELEWELLRYDDPDAELAPAAELAAAEGRPAPAAAAAADGRFSALKLEFTLPTSAYATMLVRELTKMPTDAAFVRGLVHPE